MMSDPENKEYILLETNLEAQTAYDVGLITLTPEYVVRCYGERWHVSPFDLKPKPYCFKFDKKFIRAKRDEEKIRKIVEILESYD